MVDTMAVGMTVMTAEVVTMLILLLLLPQSDGGWRSNRIDGSSPAMVYVVPTWGRFSTYPSAKWSMWSCLPPTTTLILLPTPRAGRNPLGRPLLSTHLHLMTHWDRSASRCHPRVVGLRLHTHGSLLFQDVGLPRGPVFPLPLFLLGSTSLIDCPTTPLHFRPTIHSCSTHKRPQRG